jgi:alpha-N-acetylglucosamine transferase
MKDTELHKIEQLKSDSLREIKYLIKNGNFNFGRGQSTSADWIYFDTILDFDRLRKKFKLMDNIVLHENLDPKSGTEKGFIDKRTGEGLMGKLR